MGEDTEEVKRYENRGGSVYLWRARAKELHSAARLVWEGSNYKIQLADGSTVDDPLLYRPAQLLMGLSLEVALRIRQINHIFGRTVRIYSAFQIRS